MRAWLLLVLLFLLAACAPQPSGAPPAASPTSILSTATPTATPTITPTPTPTPLPHPAAFDEAFARRLIRYDPESGQWLVSVVRTADGRRQMVELRLLPDTFATHDDLRLKNPLAPYTVRALDEDGRQLTLIWNPEKAEFRLAYTFPALFEGVGTENPRLIAENLEKIPFIPIEDIQSGFAVQSLLSHILDRMDQGESLADILYMNPDATRYSWEKFGGNSLLFKLLPNKKIALLKAKGNDQAYGGTLRYDNATMKPLPFGTNIEINGQNYFAFYIANFDPLDPQNPDPNELSNWKFFLGIRTHAILPINSIEQNSPLNFESAFRAKNPAYPWLYLYATNPNLDPNDPNTIVIPNPNNPDNSTLLDARDPFQSLLAQLLSIEGNDAGNLIFPRYNNKLIDDFNNEFSLLSPSEPVREILIAWDNIPQPFDPNVQKYILLFEVGVAQ